MWLSSDPMQKLAIRHRRMMGRGKTEFDDELYCRFLMLDLSFASFSSSSRSSLSSSLLWPEGVWDVLGGEVSSSAGR